jgi:hypothetical protein
MDLSARKSKVVRPKEVGGSSELVFGAAVDTDILQMLQTLREAGDNQSFDDLLSSGIQKIGYDLRLAHHLIRQQDKCGLDQLAQGLSQNALKIGAVRILSTAIEIQGLARIGDFMAITQLVTGLEEELRTVEKQLV